MHVGCIEDHDPTQIPFWLFEVKSELQVMGVDRMLDEVVVATHDIGWGDSSPLLMVVGDGDGGNDGSSCS